MKKLAIIGILIGILIVTGCQQGKQQTEEDIVQEPDTTQQEEQQSEEESEDSAAVDLNAPEVVLAKCITEKGIKLYTSRTCGHCKNQKALFGDGLQFLNNVECLSPMGGWSQECINIGIESVPSWVFPDGVIESGARPLEEIAELTQCPYTVI